MSTVLDRRSAGFHRVIAFVGNIEAASVHVDLEDPPAERSDVRTLVVANRSPLESFGDLIVRITPKGDQARIERQWVLRPGDQFEWSVDMSHPTDIDVRFHDLFGQWWVADPWGRCEPETA
jgi:hypothetical protein